MSRCTAPVYGHRTASGAANCPLCGRRSSYRPSYSYSPPVTSYRSGGGESSPRGGASGRGVVGRREVVSYPRRELSVVHVSRVALDRAPGSQGRGAGAPTPGASRPFLCHAWEDRNGCATELFDLLKSNDATVWFSERDIGLGKSLLREIDKGLVTARIGVVLVTAALLTSMAAEGIADKELSALLDGSYAARP